MMLSTLESSVQMLFLLVALGGLPFAAGTLLLRFVGNFSGTRIRWSQALILSGVAVQGLFIPFFAGVPGAVLLAALLVQNSGMKFWKGALPLTVTVWMVNAVLLYAGKLLFFHQF